MGSGSSQGAALLALLATTAALTAGPPPLTAAEPTPQPVVRVWLSHDGYRDPDDNLSMLIGGAQAESVDHQNPLVDVAGFVYGDTRDGGQFYMLNPAGEAPEAYGVDRRYADTDGNRVAAGNYAFYRDYGRAALRDLGIDAQFDLLAEDDGGRRRWNFHARARSELSSAAAALADDIRAAVASGAAGGGPSEVVVYSAGGGANVAAEAIGYLLGRGLEHDAIRRNFAIVQHGRSNWEMNYEPEARALTVGYTIAISNQNAARYANGMRGPDLKHAVPKDMVPDGSDFGPDFAKALAVATGNRPFKGPGSDAGVTFRPTADASDAGSHAFAVDRQRLLAAWDDRMVPGDELPGGSHWEHRIEGVTGPRMRVIYDRFDPTSVAALVGERPRARPQAPPVPPPAARPVEVAELPRARPPFVPPRPAARPQPASGDFVAPFATSGMAAALDGARIYTPDGPPGLRDGGYPVGGEGARASLGLDFGTGIREVTLRLSGLGGGKASGAAELTAYEARGRVLDTFLIVGDGPVSIAFSGPVRYATLAVADRPTDEGRPLPRRSSGITLDALHY